MTLALPVRWWRDDETRLLSRAEYSNGVRHPHFNLSEIPRGDNPEIDAQVAELVERGGCFETMIEPIEFETLEPQTTEFRIKLDAPLPPVRPIMFIFGSEDDL